MTFCSSNLFLEDIIKLFLHTCTVPVEGVVLVPVRLNPAGAAMDAGAALVAGIAPNPNPGVAVPKKENITILNTNVYFLIRFIIITLLLWILVL